MQFNSNMATFDSKRNPSLLLSSKASQLHRSVLQSFNEKDRVTFIEILSTYQLNKNVQRLVESLSQICDTPQKCEEIYPLMRSFVPQKHKERFDNECNRPKSAYGRHYHTYSKRNGAKYGYGTTRSLPSAMRYTQSPSSLQPRTPTPRRTKPSDNRNESNARIVVLVREFEGESFGFCIRGGSEYNIGLFVSSVDRGSLAHTAGVCLGDQILEVNRIDFTNISHQEAVKVIQEAAILHMLVKSVGKIPASFKSSSSYRWTDPRGNEVSPPSQYATMVNGDKSEMRLLGAEDERKVNLFVADGAEIGLKIRGGVEHGLGIFIASVERNSGADRAGIQVGDQILDVNGKCFLNISHDEAVRVLKSSQQLVIMLKDVGILPHGKRVYDETQWIKDTEPTNSSRSSSTGSKSLAKSKMPKTPSFHDRMGSSQLTHYSVLDHSDEILEMKARQLLPSDDLHAFAFYLNEYRTTRLSLTSFLSVLSDQLNTPEKGLLFKEIRSAILPRDLTKFDEWIEKTRHTRTQTEEIRQTRRESHDRMSLYSYKSSDSSMTMDSWLGLFENDDKHPPKGNLKFRRMQDALPHPPKAFFDDSFESDGTSYVGSQSRDLTLDFTPLPVVDLSSEETEKQRSLDAHLNINSPIDKKCEKFFCSTSTSTPALQESHLAHYQDVTTVFDCVCTDNNIRSNSGYFKTDSTYHNSDLFTPMDYNKPNRVSGNVMNDGLSNGDDNVDALYNTVKHSAKCGEFNSTPVDKVVFNSDARDRVRTSVDNDITSNSKVLQEKGEDSRCSEANNEKRIFVQNGHKGFPTGNGFIRSEALAIDATVNKASTFLKDTKIKCFADEFETPPSIADRLFLENNDFCEGSETDHYIDSENNRHHSKRNNAAKQGVEPPKSTQTNDRNGVSNAVDVEKSVKSNIEHMQKLNGKSSIVQKDRNVAVKRLTKGKNKSKSNFSQIDDPVDYSQPFVVELTKHSNNLGLSVAGGTDTDSKEIRIKSIKSEDTVVGSCPLLKPGQIILGVDEKSLHNVTSGIAAMAIRQAFHSDKTVLKLIIQDDS